MAKHRGIKDSGEYFVINPVSRKIIVPHAHKSIGTVGDHNSEQITFECPQIIDGHDISQCERRYVTWNNVNGEAGHDRLDIVEVEQGAEGMLYLSWTVRDGLTVAKGIVQFSVHFEDFDENGIRLYRWSTASCKDCDILDSVNEVLGAYEAVYVAGNALVFGDYNAVKGGTLEIKTDGIIPEGTLQINENGIYPVGEYAQVNVDVINDPDLIPENIKSGVTIHGVTGTYNQLPLEYGGITMQSYSDSFDVDIFFAGRDEEQGILFMHNHKQYSVEKKQSEYCGGYFVRHSMIIINITKLWGAQNIYFEAKGAYIDYENTSSNKDIATIVFVPTGGFVDITIGDGRLVAG